MGNGGSLRSLCSALAFGALFSMMVIPSAGAAEYSRTLTRADRGKDVAALRMRLAGWFPKADQTFFSIKARFDARTARAVVSFQKHYGLATDGVAGPQVFEVLDRLEDKDGSTAHFDYAEFWQNRSGNCSAKANGFAGTFGGGMASPRRTKRNVRRLMWRLEALRAKGGDNPIGINSGFRSVAYNKCIGGASLSQHLYGTAADSRMARVANSKERDIARRSQLHGIGCYSYLSHNHFDLRLQNRDLPGSRFWWWPKQDSKGRDLDEAGKPCWGEGRRGRVAARSLAGVAAALPGAGSFVPSVLEVEAFEDAGEPADLRGAD